MKAEHRIFAGFLGFLALAGCAKAQSRFSSTEKGNGKQEGKREVPTFVGSDGVVRKVSPGAILEEMKRCLPPGLPIPIVTAWPELPAHLEDLQEAGEPKKEPGGTCEGDLQNLKDPTNKGIFQEKKRVSRSNDKNPGDIGIDAANDQSMNVKLEGPTKETGIFSPKNLNQNKMAQVLKDMLSRQMRKQNFTAEYVDDFSLRPRLRKAKQMDEYEDYDYVEPEEPKTAARAKSNQSGRYATTSSHAKGPRKSRSRNRWKNKRKIAHRRQLNSLRKKPDYDYDYEEGAEDPENNQSSDHQSTQPAKGHVETEDHIQSDELERQIELNDFLEKNLNNDGIPERMENIDKFIKSSGHFKLRSGANMDVLEGYQKMLAVIMKLNTTLIRLLDKFSTAFQKTLPEDTAESTGHQSDDKSKVIWDFMDLLMQQRRSARRKRENCRCPLEKERAVEKREAVSSEGTPTRVASSSAPRTNLDLMKWLCKWYLSSTSK